jgi:hypothetical protein
VSSSGCWRPTACVAARSGGRAAWTLGEGQQEGARVVGKLGVDAWGLPEAGCGAGRAAAAVSGGGLLRGRGGAKEEEGGAPGAEV